MKKNARKRKNNGNVPHYLTGSFTPQRDGGIRLFRNPADPDSYWLIPAAAINGKILKNGSSEGKPVFRVPLQHGAQIVKVNVVVDVDSSKYKLDVRAARVGIQIAAPPPLPGPDSKTFCHCNDSGGGRPQEGECHIADSCGSGCCTMDSSGDCWCDDCCLKDD